jgi:hypothetical protein
MDRGFKLYDMDGGALGYEVREFWWEWRVT